MFKNPKKFFTWFGYTVAIIVIVVGFSIVAGLLIPDYVPKNFRFLLGIVFVLYGVYRIITLWTKSRQEFNNEN